MRSIDPAQTYSHGRHNEKGRYPRPASRLISGRCQTDIEIYIGPMSVFKAVQSRAAHILQRVLMSVRCRLLYRPDIEMILNRCQTDIEIYIGPMSVFRAVRSRAAHILQRVLMLVRCRYYYIGPTKK